MPETHWRYESSDLETSLFLDAIIAHMAFLESHDLSTRAEAHNSFVEAIRALHEFLSGPVDHQR
jgi:hypothetical protein